MAELIDNSERQRFEMAVDGSVAFVTYRLNDDTLTLLHTEVPQALGGRGLGSALAQSVLDEARRRGLHVVPRCEFLAGYIQRHPAYADLVATPGRGKSA
jgi:predicted GNAT family acetyltransferase